MSKSCFDIECKEKRASKPCFYTKSRKNLAPKAVFGVEQVFRRTFPPVCFDNKMVLVFDDVITKGLSYAKYANQLESLGACVIAFGFVRHDSG